MSTDTNQTTPRISLYLDITGTVEEVLVTSRTLILGLCGFCLAMSIPACGSGNGGSQQDADRVKVVVLPFLSLAPF